MNCGSVMIPKSCLPGSYDTVFVVSQCPITGSVSNFSQFTIAAIFLIWAHTLCKHVTCIHSPGTGKLLKQDHYHLPQGVEGVECPIIPRSHPVVQYLCHRLQHHHVCACVYYIHMCQSQTRPLPGERPPSGSGGSKVAHHTSITPVVQYLCHRLQHHHVCACVYYIHMCQYECVHAPPRHSLTEHVHT